MKIIYLSFLSLALCACGNSNTEQEMNDEVTEIENNSIAFNFDPTKVLNYEIGDIDDVSYTGNSRLTVKVMLNISEIPSEEEIKMTSYKIFKENTQEWNEVTIWSYLPEMNMKSSAYSIFEINDKGEVEFFTNDASLIDTKWYNEN